MILLHGMECFMTRTRFDWQDPFFLDSQLGEEERLIRDATRDYCQARLMPCVLEANRREQFDRIIMNELGSWGCSAPPCRSSTAAPGSITWPTASSPGRWSGSTVAIARP